MTKVLVRERERATNVRPGQDAATDPAQQVVSSGEGAASALAIWRAIQRSRSACEPSDDAALQPADEPGPSPKYPAA